MENSSNNNHNNSLVAKLRYKNLKPNNEFNDDIPLFLVCEGRAFTKKTKVRKSESGGFFEKNVKAAHLNGLYAHFCSCIL